MQHLHVKSLYKDLKIAASPQRKLGAEDYLRNQFEFLGVDTATRRIIFKQWLASGALPPYEMLPELTGEMWQKEREMQYCAIELAAGYKKEWTIPFIEVIEAMIVSDSWWDTVDAASALLCGPYFKKFPAQVKAITGRWNRSENTWLQRSSLLFQLKYKQQTDTVLLAKYILRLASSGEFFVQKAIGWVLREYAKTDAAWVRQFVQAHTLKPLSRREALKNIIE